jgi:hypothetical protein
MPGNPLLAALQAATPGQTADPMAQPAPDPTPAPPQVAAPAPAPQPTASVPAPTVAGQVAPSAPDPNAQPAADPYAAALAAAQPDAGAPAQGDPYAAALQAAQPDQVDPNSQGIVGDTITGFNNKFYGLVANVIGVPIGAVDQAMGYAHLSFMQNPYSARDAIMAGFVKLGLSHPDANTLANKVGGAVGQGAIEAYLATLAAPSMAAVKVAEVAPGLWNGAVRTAQMITKGLGEMIQAAPVDTITTNATSAGGATYGGEKGGTPGALLGGLIGGGVPNVLEGLGRGMVGTTKRLIDTFKPASGAPIFNPTGRGAGFAQSFSNDQVNGDVAKAGQALYDAVKGDTSLPRTAGGSQASTLAIGDRVNAAYDYSKSIENELWSRVDKTATATPTALNSARSDLAKIRAEAAQQNPKDMPPEVAALNQLIANTQPTVNELGQVVRQGKPLTVERVLALRASILKVQRTANAATANGQLPLGTTDTYLTNLTKVAGAALKLVENTIPESSVELQQARAFSKVQANLFEKGPVGTLIRGQGKLNPGVPLEDVGARPINVGQPNLGVVPPKINAFDALTTTDQGQSQALQIQQMLRTHFGDGSPLGPVDASLPGSRPPTSATDVVGAIQDTARNLFREAADQGGSSPDEASAAGEKWINANIGRLQAFAKPAQELSDTLAHITTLQQQRDAISNNVFSRFAKGNPDDAITAVFNSGDPVLAAKGIASNLAENTGALEGFRNGMISHFIAKFGDNPRQAYEAWRNSDQWSPVFKAIMQPDEYARMTRVITAAAGVAAKGNGGLIVNSLSGGIVLIGRVAGARFLRNALSGTGTIQIPTLGASMGARVAKRFAERIFHYTPPADLLKWGMQDPKWEGVLLSRAPTSVAEYNTLTRRLQLAIKVQQGARNSDYTQGSGGRSLRAAGYAGLGGVAGGLAGAALGGKVGEKLGSNIPFIGDKIGRAAGTFGGGAIGGAFGAAAGIGISNSQP